MSDHLPSHPAAIEYNNAWSNWPKLRSFDWSWFITLTFPFDITPDRAKKKWLLFVDNLAKEVLPRGKAKRQGLPWVYSIEGEDRPHIHALIKGATEYQITSVWRSITSERSRVDISKYMPELDGYNYVVKSAAHADVSWRYFKQ